MVIPENGEPLSISEISFLLQKQGYICNEEGKLWRESFTN